MLATLAGNGAAWSVATLPAIKVNSHRFQRLVKVAVGTKRTWPDVRLESAFGGRAEVEFRGRQDLVDDPIADFIAPSYIARTANVLWEVWLRSNMSCR